MISLHHEIFGRQYAGVAYWAINTNIANPISGYFGISTINGNIEIDWKDGSSKTNYITTKNTDSTLSINNNTNVSLMPSHTFPSNFIQNVEIKCLSGLNDVYSLYFGGHGMVINQDFVSFINQFPNLYSINIDIPHSNAYFNGDISQIPNKVEKIYIRDFKNSGNLYLNISNFNINSQLKEFKSIYGQYGHIGFANISGDLSKLPPLIKIFTLKHNLANTLTYTSGRTWAYSFDTLDLGNATMSFTDIDNLLNDMNNSITTAIGSKVININGFYTNTTAYNGLIAKGFTITGLILYVPYELIYDFNGNFNEKNGLNNLVQNGTVPFTTDRKGSNTAIQFGSGYLATVNNLPASSLWSVSFWIKTTQTTESNQFELGGSWNLADSFMIAMNVTAWSGTNRLSIHRSNDRKTVPYIINNGLWHHVYIEMDRTKPIGLEVKVLIDNIEQSLINVGNVETAGSFRIDKLYIGGRNGGSYLYNGALDDIKIYNRALTQTEITNLYNE